MKRFSQPVFGLLGVLALASCAGADHAPSVARAQPSTTSLSPLPLPRSDAATPAPPPAPAAAPAPPTRSVASAPQALDAGSASSDSGDGTRPASSEADTAKAAGSPRSSCNEQPPQDFLVRGNFLRGGAAAAQRAIQYRTETYGYFTGFGRPGPDARPPGAFAVATTFMGLPIKMHVKVVPALHCVEAEIKRTCTLHPYVAHALAGIRFRNTYRGGEVTNHIYGIAIDVDPSLNTCCGCVKPWNEAPACQRKAATEYDRMAMPECWVHAFERYGFYWLGHDVLRDTMHFEFLGDPDRILKSAPSTPEVAPSGTDRELW